MGVPEDAGGYESYQNESETTTLLSPSPPSSPTHSGRNGGGGRGGAGGALDDEKEDVRKHYRRALGTGYMFAMGVCGIVLVALGSTLDDLAENCGTTSIAVSWRVKLVKAGNCLSLLLVCFTFLLASSEIGGWLPGANVPRTDDVVGLCAVHVWNFCVWLVALGRCDEIRVPRGIDWGRVQTDRVCK